MNTAIISRSPNDWDQVTQAGLKVVVDPMVFRTAEVFLRGARRLAKSPELKHPATMWNAIKSNIGALCTFFDMLILEERLPMYDYGMTRRGLPHKLYRNIKVISMKVKVLKNKSGKILATFEPSVTSAITMETQVAQLEPQVSKEHMVEEMEMPEDYVSHLDIIYKKKPTCNKRTD